MPLRFQMHSSIGTSPRFSAAECKRTVLPTKRMTDAHRLQIEIA